MTDKEKYKALMLRYWDAGTTQEEERELAIYAAMVNDPDFEELRGVLGYLSIGREKKSRRSRSTRLYSFAAVVASIVVVVTVGLGLGIIKPEANQDLCVRYVYGEQVNVNDIIMDSVESSLVNFFAGNTPAEVNLSEMFKR